MLRLALILAVAIASQAAAGTPRVLQFLEDRHTHAFVRPSAVPEGGDPPERGRADCSAIRAMGRREQNTARQIGRMFERAAVHLDELVTSGVCRMVQAALAFELRPVTHLPMLDPGAGGSMEAQVELILTWIDGLRPSNTALLVTQGDVIEAVTGVAVAPGEGVVFRLPRGGDPEILGTFAPPRD